MLRAPLLMIALVLSGLGAATVSRTAFVLIACVLMVGFTLSAPSTERFGYWLISVVGSLCSIPILSEQGPTLVIPVIYLGLLPLLMLDKRGTLIRPGAGALLIFYGILAIATLYFSFDDRGAFVVYGLLMTTAVPVWFVASNATRTEIVLVVRALFALTAVQVAVSIYEVFVRSRPIWPIGFDGSNLRLNGLESSLFPELIRASGTFGHPLPQAIIYVATFAVALTLGIRIPAATRWSIYALAIAGCILGSARSALLTMAVLAVVSIWRSSKVRAVLTMAVLTVAALIVDIFVDLGVRQGIDEFAESGSYTHRFGVLDAVPEVLARPDGEVLFGHGVRGQRIILQYLSDQVSSIDNQYVNALITAGIVGFVAFLALLATAWSKAPQLRIVLLGLLCMFISFDVLAWQSTLAVAMTLLGFAVTSGSATTADDLARAPSETLVAPSTSA